jgi:hypothetical protein
MTRAPVEARAKTYSFRFQGTNRDILVASAPVKDSPGLHLVFTLGSGLGSAFLTVTDGDERQVADLLARLEDYSVSASLDVGHTLVLESEYLTDNGRKALLLLEPRVSNILRGIPDEVPTGAGLRTCYLVVFLSVVEYTTKLNGGVGVLLEQFKNEGKDLVAMRAAGAVFPAESR